jgi:cell division septal protein FtsQ
MESAGMKSLEERFEDIKEDPKKMRRAFNAVWIIAYGMLILGFIFIVWILLQGL